MNGVVSQTFSPVIKESWQGAPLRLLLLGSTLAIPILLHPHPGARIAAFTLMSIWAMAGVWTGGFKATRWRAGVSVALPGLLCTFQLWSALGVAGFSPETGGRPLWWYHPPAVVTAVIFILLLPLTLLPEEVSV